MNNNLNLALRITARDETRGAVDRIRQSVERVRRATGDLGTRASAAGNQIRTGLERGAEGGKRLSDSIAGARQQLKLFIAGIVSFNGLASLTRYADQWSTLQARLRLVTQGQEEFNIASQETFEIAQRTRTGLDATVNLYARLQSSVRGLGGSQRDALALTEAISQSFAISGTEAGAASGAILQLGQALAAGALRGDEFNSVAEASPRLMQALADGLGVPIGKLRELAQEGKLTADVVAQALLNQKEKLAAEYATIPKTVSGALQQLKNAFVRYVGDLDQATGASKTLANAIVALSNNIDLLAKALGAVLAVIGGAWLARLAGAARAAGGLAAVVGKLRGGLAGLSVFGAIEAFSRLGNLWESVKKTFADNRAFDQTQERLKNIEILTRRVADGTATAADIQQLAVLKAQQAWAKFSERLPFTVGQLQSVQGAARSLADQIGRRLVQATEQAGEVLKRLGDGAQTGLQQLKASLDAQLRTIQQHTQERLRVLENSQASERERILQGANIEREGAQARLQAIREWAADSVRLASEVYGRMAELARASGDDVASIEQQGLDARLQIYRQMEDAYRQTIDQMIAEEQRLLREARAADEERARLKMSVEDRIRALRQKGMDDYSAYQDRLRQIDEKNAKARQALEQGNFELAKKYAEQAISLAERNANEVTRRVTQGGKTMTQVLVSESQASATAINKINEAAKIADAALKGVADSNRSAAKNIEAGYAEAAGQLELLKQKIGDLQQLKELKIKASIEGDMEAAQKLVQEFQALRDLQAVALRIESNAGDVLKELDELVKNANDISSREFKVKVKADAETLLASLDELNDKLHAATELGVNIPADLDLTVARGTLRVLSEDMDSQLQAPRGVKLDTREAEATISKITQPTESTHRVKPDTWQAQQAIAELQRDTFSTHTVYVRQVQTRADGGVIQGYAQGGAIPRFRRVWPGRVSGPGTSTSDSIPALLSAGEFVIRASSVRKYGQALLHAINMGLLPKRALPRFADGGEVGRMPAMRIPGFDPGALNVNVQMPGDAVRVEANINGQRATLYGARDQANALANALRNLSRGA